MILGPRTWEDVMASNVDHSISPADIQDVFPTFADLRPSSVAYRVSIALAVVASAASV